MANFNLSRNPIETRTIYVFGTHAPIATVARIPATVPYGGRQWMRLTYRTDAGLPLGGWPVLVHAGSAQVVGRVMLTDAAGQLTLRLYRGVPLFLDLQAARDAAGARALLRTVVATRYERYSWVSAVPASAAVRVGRVVTVTGTVNPPRGIVSLQRLVGRTWKLVAGAGIRASGRYTLTTTSTAVGAQYLRVVARGPNLAPTASRVFVVAGTRR